MSVKVALPPIDLGLVVRSHGWYDLPPFTWDSERKRLGFVFLEEEEPVRVAGSERAEWAGRDGIGAFFEG